MSASEQQPPLGAPAELRIGGAWERGVVCELADDGYVVRLTKLGGLVYSHTFEALHIDTRLPHPALDASARIRLSKEKPWLVCRVAAQLQPAPAVLLQVVEDPRQRFDSRMFAALAIELQLLPEEPAPTPRTPAAVASTVVRGIAHWESGSATSVPAPRASNIAAHSSPTTPADTRARFEPNSSVGIDSDDSFATAATFDTAAKEYGDPNESFTSTKGVYAEETSCAPRTFERKSSGESSPVEAHKADITQTLPRAVSPTEENGGPVVSPRSVTPIKPFLVDRKATDDLSVGTKKRFSAMQKRPSQSAFAQRLRSLGLTYPAARAPVSDGKAMDDILDSLVDIGERQMSLPVDYVKQTVTLIHPDEKASAEKNYSDELPPATMTAFVQGGDGNDDPTVDDHINALIRRLTASIRAVSRSDSTEADMASALSQASRRVRKQAQARAHSPSNDAVSVVSVQVRASDSGKTAPFKQWMLNVSCTIADSFHVRLQRTGYQSMPTTIGFEGHACVAQAAAAAFIAVFDRVHRMARAYVATKGDTAHMTRSAYALAVANRIAERVRRDTRKREKVARGSKALRFTRTAASDSDGMRSAAEQVAASGMGVDV